MSDTVQERSVIPIRRSARSQGENQRRRAQPGTYASAWSSSVIQPKSWLPAPVYTTKSEAPADLRERAARKLLFIQRFVSEGCPRGELQNYALLAAQAQGIPVEAVPPYTTLNTWVHQFKTWGFEGLIDRVRTSAGTTSLTEEQQQNALAAYLGAKMSYRASARFVAKHTPYTDPPPSYQVVRRFLQQYELEHRHFVVLCRQGVTAYRNEFQLTLSHGVVRGGEVYAIDSTVADRWVRIPDPEIANAWKPVRAVLTVVEDLGSRAFLAFNLSLAPIDSGIMLGVFRRAVVPEANFPGLPSFGLPDRILVDAGSEYLGQFAAAMEAEQVEVLRGAGNAPERNGRVERLIQTVTTEVLANGLGYSPTHKAFNAYAPNEQDSKRTMRNLQYDPYRLEVPVEALDTIEELEGKILAWATLYNEREHPSLALNSSALREMLLEAQQWEQAWTEAA
jgi:hypothetical protein